MSTIQDVARHAAVSVSTVSNVLNGRTDKMRQETLARVEAAIEALQFRPNTLARQLKTGQTPLLGLLVPSIANPMYGYIAREVETFAQEQYGYRVLIGNTYRDREKEASFFDDLLAHGVRRVIVISSLADERHLERAVQRGMVVVSYDRRATPGEMFGSRSRRAGQLRSCAHRHASSDRARPHASRVCDGGRHDDEPQRQDPRLPRRG